MPLAFPKPSATRDRLQAKRDRDRDLEAAISAVWERDGFKCRSCHRRVIKSVGAGLRGHVHHIEKRSQSKVRRAAVDNLVLLCSLCHADVHGYRLLVQGYSSARVTFTRVSV